MKVFIPRPNAVLNTKYQVSDRIKIWIMTHVDVDELGAALVDLAVHGGDKQFYENEDLVEMGKKLLASTK